MWKAIRIIVIWLAAALLAGCSATRCCPSKCPPAQRTVEQQATALVRLNYVYLTVDDETLKAISESEFLRDRFCRFGYSRAGTEMGWSAIYLLGQDTCVELVAPGGPETNIEGNGGICFSTAKSGDINIIYDRLRNAMGPDIQKGTRTFNTGKEEVPWYSFVSSHCGEQAPPLLTWVTEQNPMFHKAIGYRNAQRPGPAGVELAALAQSSMEGDRLLGDITGITLVVTGPEFERLAAELSAYGYARNDIGDATIFRGPGLELCVAISSDPGYRIRGIRCSLTERPDSAVQIDYGGKAALSLRENATAMWTFGPQAKHFAQKWVDGPAQANQLVVRDIRPLAANTQ